jgi:hypothetical protein
MAEPTPPTALEQAADIARDAAGPHSVTADGVTATGHGVEERIKADKYLLATASARQPRRGLAFTQLIPPGTVYDGDARR